MELIILCMPNRLRKNRIARQASLLANPNITAQLCKLEMKIPHKTQKKKKD